MNVFIALFTIFFRNYHIYIVSRDVATQATANIGFRKKNKSTTPSTTYPPSNKASMKYFFKLVRLILGPFLILKEQLTKPKGMLRTADEQVRVDADCQQLALYQFSTCPFCIKVRQEIRRLSLNIEKRDAQHSTENRQALLTQGGSSKVPCLKISEEDGKTRWLYGSKEIIAYLQQRFTITNQTGAA